MLSFDFMNDCSYNFIYDYEDEYLDGPVFWDNYRELIDYLAEKDNGGFRKIIFFPRKIPIGPIPDVSVIIISDNLIIFSLSLTS